MLKRMFFSIGLFAAAALFADAISIGRSRNGFPLIVPQVQRLKAASGSFRLPGKLTVTVPESLDVAPLEKVYERTVPEGAVERAQSGALCRFELVKSGVPESPEGYTLAVTPAGITVKARDVRGLFYGMQTLGWMLRNRADTETLRCCFITDWPDLKVRGLFYQLRYVKPEQVDRVCHVIDTFGALKYNTLLITFADNFPYTDSPFTGRDTTLSRADVEKILAAAKRNHMEVVPYLQLISHANWMDTHKDWANLKEGKTNAFCLSNPDLQPLIEKVVRETADLIKPRYFHIGLDEIEQCRFPQCPKCKVADTEKQMLEHLLPVKKLLAERGITPIVYQDQFFGFGEPKIVKGLGITNFPEKFGMDTVIESWEYGSHPSPMIADSIKKRGFERFRYMSFAIDPANAENLPKLAAKIGAEGVTIAYWSMIPATIDRHDRSRYTFYPSFIAQANYSWNACDAALAKLPFDSAQVFQELLDGTPERTFRGKATPIPLGKAFNSELAADPLFPAFDAEISEKIRRIAAADPAKFEVAVRSGAPLAVVLSGYKNDGFAAGPVTIPVGCTASGASFLVSAAYFNNFALPGSFKLVGIHVPIGKFKIVYADGSAKDIPLTMYCNVNDWNSYLGGNLCRAVVRGNDRNGALFGFYAVDWRNPKPEVEIREIVFSSKGGTMVAPILLACSLSDTAKEPAGAAGTPPKRFASPERPGAKFTPMVDFSSGLPRKSQGEAKGVAGYSFEASGGALEMRMPETQKFLGRVFVDIPIGSVPDFESIVFRAEAEGFEAVYRSDFYMMGRGGEAGVRFAVELDKRGRPVCIPRERLFRKDTKLALDKVRTIRFGFFMTDNGVPCTVRIGRVEYCDQVLPYRDNVSTPVK